MKLIGVIVLLFEEFILNFPFSRSVASGRYFKEPIDRRYLLVDIPMCQTEVEITIYFGRNHRNEAWQYCTGEKGVLKQC